MSVEENSRFELVDDQIVVVTPAVSVAEKLSVDMVAAAAAAAAAVVPLD